MARRSEKKIRQEESKERSAPPKVGQVKAAALKKPCREEKKEDGNAAGPTRAVRLHEDRKKKREGTNV